MAKQDVSIQYLENKLSQNARSLVFSRLADCYRKKGEIQQAIGVCKQGLKIHPDYVTARVLLGRCYLEQEKLKEAVAEFVKALELDRRNQIAVKMIADVYARQGMREKAGDLYGYLVRMDPDNRSLVRLTADFKGTGATDIRDILGIGPAGAAREKVSADTIIDADKTIQMDMGKRGPEAVFQETGDLSEMLVKTQKFDAKDLIAADDAETLQVEEVVTDTQKTEAGIVTGDDISSRMETIFGEGEKGEAAGVTEETIEVTGETAVDIGEATGTAAAGEVAGGEPAQEAHGLTGSDITSRIDQLFEEGKTGEQAQDEADFTQLFEVPEETVHKGDETEARTSAPTKEMKLKDVVSEDTSISGDDVTDRLGEMFEEFHPADVLEELDVKEEEPAETQAAEVAEKATEEDVAPVAADAVRIEEAADDQALSGDDVAFRLETIFEEEKEKEKVAETSAVEEPLTAAEDEKQSKPEEETKVPFVIGDEMVVVAEDTISPAKRPEEDTFSASETIEVSARLPASKAGAGGREEVQAAPSEEEAHIDDAVAPEEEPKMSGDDVAGRLDELFSEDLEEDVTAPASVPDEEESEKTVAQGFPAMSGEDARKGPSDNTLDEELDKVEIDRVGHDSFIATRAPEEKTVLLDEDSADTMFAEDETIATDGRDPFLSKPATISETAGQPQADGSYVKPQDRTEMMTPEETVRYDDDSEKTRPTDRPYSIPDHVLTPTLADIYFQQGQPQLAMQIYKRLLEADPDNERIAQRLKEIEDHIEEISGQETIAFDAMPHAPSPRQIYYRRESVEAKKTESPDEKPLAGVKIKKKFKSRFRKKR